MEIPAELLEHMPLDTRVAMERCDTALIALVGFSPNDHVLIPHAWFAPELDRDTGTQLLRKLAYRFENPEMPEPRAMITATIGHIEGAGQEANARVTLSGDVESLGPVGIISALMHLVNVTAQKAGIPITIDHDFQRADPDANGAYL